MAMLPPPTLYTPPLEPPPIFLDTVDFTAKEDIEVFATKAKEAGALPALPPRDGSAHISSAALVVGLDYRGTQMELAGCINDAINVRDMLISKGYEVHTITDEFEVVTKRDVCMALMSLILHPTATRLYFHYSGHGSQVRDANGDEIDGLDECLALQFEDILDDELRGMVCCVDEGKRLMCVLDCCHSGSGMDLKYTLYESFGGGNTRKNRFHRDSRSAVSTRGEVLLLSGCQDEQTSADMTVRGQAQGAMTASILKTLRDTPKLRFIDLLRGCRDELKRMNCGQYPSFSSGRSDMDINRVFDY